MIDHAVQWFAILTGMEQRPEPPPWGELITKALRGSGLSARKAAQLAGLSDGRWRQIVTGYQNVSTGVYAPVRGPAETLARMAKVVGVTPDQLAEAGRPDAAEELRVMTGSGQGTPAEWTDIARLISEYRALVAQIIERIPDRNRASVGAAADLTASLVEESTGTDQSK